MWRSTSRLNNGAVRYTAAPGLSSPPPISPCLLCTRVNISLRVRELLDGPAAAERERESARGCRHVAADRDDPARVASTSARRALYGSSGDGRMMAPGASQPFGADDARDGLVMHAKLGGNRADRPVLGVAQPRIRASIRAI